MVKGSRFVYLAGVMLFLLGVVVQVFLAGMVVVASQMWWDPHVGLGHSLAGPLLIMLVSMYLGRMPGQIKRLTWLLFGVYFLQADVVIFLRVQAPVVSALHPVLALFDFALALALARVAVPLTRTATAPAPVQPEMEPSLHQ